MRAASKLPRTFIPSCADANPPTLDAAAQACHDRGGRFVLSSSTMACQEFVELPVRVLTMGSNRAGQHLST